MALWYCAGESKTLTTKEIIMQSKPYAEAIALAALSIGAIELRPKNPFKWASGTFNPIYNDNRMLLGEYKHRQLVAWALIDVITKNNLHPYYVCGTYLSGIAPAWTVCELSGYMLAIRDEEDTIYEFNNSFATEPGDTATAIASTAPWLIPLGVQTANQNEMPFMYLRPNRKTHGKEKQIEGNPHVDQRVHLLYDSKPGDIEAASQRQETLDTILKEATGGMCSDDWYPLKKDWRQLPKGNYEDKPVVVIEDLISTGGSALKEVNALRRLGMNVFGVISIFNYGLDSAKKAFEEANCPVWSVLTYDELLEVAKKEKMFSAKELELLSDWRLDQPNWGTKNGFPPEEKK